MQTITLNISGITCMGCVNSLHKALTALPGVQRVAVSKELANAQIDFDPAQISPAQCQNAVEEAGFDVI